MKKLHYPRHDHPQKKLLSFIDGLEGGFAIFAGIVVGLSFTTMNRTVLVVTALIGILVNAVNAATIRYSSEHYYDELDGREKRSAMRAYLLPALLEFILYVFVSLLSVIPLLAISALHTAIIVMVAVCLVILFMAGVLRGAVLGTQPIRDGIEVVIGGVIMISFGALAGWLLTHLFVK